MVTPFEFDWCPACDTAIDLCSQLYTYKDDVVCSPGCVQIMYMRETEGAAAEQ